MPDSDLVLYTDRNGLVHVMQPVRALGPEGIERVLKLHHIVHDFVTWRIMHDFVTSTKPSTLDPRAVQEALTALIELLQILLPFVDAEELEALDHTDKVAWFIRWRRAQPELTYATPPTA